MAVRFEASRGLLGPLLSLLLVYCCTIELVSSQNYCDRLPNNAELERLIADTLRTSDASTPPDITVLEVNYVCLASGRLRDTFTTFSAVVRYNCVGVRCPQSNVSQFEFGCLRGTWSNRVLGRTENLRTNVADASLNSPNRTDCSFCFSPSHSALSDNPQLEPIYDSFNHCLACDDACSEGDMKCFGFGDNECCNFYDPRNNFRCLNQCPTGFDVNQDFECIRTVGFSASNYTFSESDGVGIVTIDGTPGVQVRIMGGPDGNPPGVRISGTFVDETVVTPADILFNITNDAVAFENDEVYSLILIVDDPTITVELSSTEITIEDDGDSIQVGFDSGSYVLQEGDTSGVGVRVSGETATDAFVFFMQEGERQREIALLAGEYTAETIILTEITNPDNQIALQDDNIIQLSLLVPPQFDGGIELGGQIESFLTSSTSDLVILDNDVVTISFDPTSYTILESESERITLSLDTGIARGFSVVVATVMTGTPSPLLVPSLPNDTYLLNAPPSTSPQTLSFTLTPVDDQVPSEPNEAANITIVFVSDLAVVLGPDATLVIIDNDILSIVVGFLRPEYTFPESAATVPFVLVGKSTSLGVPFTITITAESESISSEFIEASAVPNELSGLVTFPAGSVANEQYFLDLRNDNVGLEDDETVTLSLSSSSDRVTIGGTVDGIEYLATTTVTVLDEDIVTLGIDRDTNRTVFEGDSTEVCVSKDLASVRAVNFLLTPLPGSAEVDDYSPNVTQPGSLQGSSTSFNPLCFSFTAVDDSLPDDGESFSVELLATDGFTSGFQIGNDRVDITILDSATPPPPTVDLEDTVVGDPLFTVPLPGIGGHLCYEIRGSANRYFNFISDSCVSVNAHYAERGTLPGQTRSLHVVDEIAILAIDNSGGCINILIKRKGCSTTINGQTLSEDHYSSDGVTVSLDGTKVTVAVPNCHILTLDLEIVCENNNGVDMIQFDVLRGLNLRETSHGLLGQFWNVSISTEEFTGDLRMSGSQLAENLVLVTLTSSGSVRKFPAWQETKTWDNRKECLFAGNQNGGTVYEVSSNQDTLIEGLYTDYVTDSAFSSKFKFSQFDSGRCTI